VPRPRVDVKEKSAELAGTYDMPGSPPKDKVPLKDKPAIQKTAAAAIEEDMVSEEALLKRAFEAGSAEPPDDNENKPVKGEQPAALPQAPVLKPKVDVSGQEPPKKLETKVAQHYALPSQGRYPLDGYDQVKTAAAYFDEWYKEMPPQMRREYCSNLVKRASALSIPVSELAQRYGGGAAPVLQLKIAFDARRSVLKDDEHVEMLDKLASASNMMDPDSLAACLTEFDRMSGLDEFWGGDVPDPYFSAFDKTAEKQESDTEPEGSLSVGNEFITKRDLVEFSKLQHKTVMQRFGDDFAKEFQADPVGIFNSLPRDQKLVVMRMANFNDSELSASAS
jgi:hypothetical protein